MPFKPASPSTIKSVSQCLLKSIESESTLLLPAGLFEDLQGPQEFPKDLDPNELRAYISETTERLKQRLLHNTTAVLRRHNSLLPIQQLPPEILSACITHSMTEIECHNHQRRLIQLSTVSWWWREVTLGTPSLWSVISSKDPEWIVSLALERSKDAPLTVLYEKTSSSSSLSGGQSNRVSVASGEFFGLVSPHTTRWADTTLPLLGSSSDSIEWLTHHPIQLSRHTRKLHLGWDGSPSTDNAITRFSGHADCLLDLKLRKLHVVPSDIYRILATTHRMISLDLDSLVASVQQEQPSRPSPPEIDLPCLTKLALKGLPSSIMDPIVRNLDPSALDMACIEHNVVEGDPVTHTDPFASFTARLLATGTWIEIKTTSSWVSLRPCLEHTRNFDDHIVIRLQGERVAILAWLRLRSLPQITREYWLELHISTYFLSENPEQTLIENLMRFSNVGSVTLWGRTESQRWIWLLSLPDVMQTDLFDSKSDNPIKSWLWPGLRYLRFNGDYADEFTILSVLLARYGSRPGGGSGAPSRLLGLEVRPGKKAWRAEVVDRIKKLVGPGCLKWVKPK
ncbi:hypothetical protein FRC05_010520 [Tulasnella sp. 425]|nr:hypothetical protein FRC05_010520 [Tulasnella sp. 425]